MIDKFIIEFGKYANYVSSYEGEKRVVSFSWPVWKLVITEMMSVLHAFMPANLKELEQFRDSIVASLNKAILDTHLRIARCRRQDTEDYSSWYDGYKPKETLCDESLRYIHDAEELIIGEPHKPVFLVDSSYAAKRIKEGGGVAVEIEFLETDWSDFLDICHKFRFNAPVITAFSTTPKNMRLAMCITSFIDNHTDMQAMLFDWRRYGYEDAIQVARRHTPSDWRQIIADIEAEAIFYFNYKNTEEE